MDKTKKLNKKIEILEKMIEDKTRSLFVEKRKVEEYSDFTKTVVDTMGGSLVAIDLDGTIKLFNKSFERLFSVKAQEGEALNIRKYLGDEVVDFLVEHEAEDHSSMETSVSLNEDNKLPVFINRNAYRDQNTKAVSGYVYSIVDIKKLKDKDELIQEQQLMLAQSSKLASLGEMASGIAHEINNPLTLIDGQIRRLGDFIVKGVPDPAKTKDLVEKIRNNVVRIAKIVQGIKKVSRRGEADPVKELNLKDILGELKNFISEKFKNQNIRFELKVAEENVQFMGRETQILQVLINLISNSYDELEKRDEKWICLESSTTSDKKLLLRLVDSGNGIEKEVVDKIFTPFFTTKEVGKGTGIGLSISKKMMQDLGGDLSYELYKDNTSFVLTLPLAG